MKLIDLLVQELPKRGGWPKGAEYAFFNNVQIGFYMGNRAAFFPEWTAGISVSPCKSAVTKEQYESALAAHNDGWIPWSGGQCPVDGNVMVELRLRDNTDATDIAENRFWNHCGNKADIIAYRLHNSASQKVEWDGEGLPPVDCECEVAQPGQIVWDKFKVIAVAGDAVFGLLNNVSAVALCVDIWSFRPIRSEADKKRDAFSLACIEVDRKGEWSNSLKFFQGVYDAIAAGKIPGVKLSD